MEGDYRCVWESRHVPWHSTAQAGRFKADLFKGRSHGTEGPFPCQRSKDTVHFTYFTPVGFWLCENLWQNALSFSALQSSERSSGNRNPYSSVLCCQIDATKPPPDNSESHREMKRNLAFLWTESSTRARQCCQEKSLSGIQAVFVARKVYSMLYKATQNAKNASNTP